MAEERPGARRAALVSFAVAVAVTGAKLVTGAVAGSLAMLSAGLDSAFDAGSAAVTLWVVRLADKPPDREHPFGHGRAENLAALGQAAVLVALSIVLGIEAVERLLRGAEVTPGRAPIGVLAGTMFVDLARVAALRRAARRHRSQALQAAALNFGADALGSVAALVGLVAARLGFGAGDALAALAVVALVCALGVRLGVSSIDVLMDRTPPDLAQRVREAAERVEGVEAVGDVRVRRSGPHALAEVTVSVGRTASVERSHEIAEAVEASVARAVPGTSAVVHVEPSLQGDEVVERVFAAANRLGLADQVHNVLAVEHPEGLWLMLHAKVDPDVPLARADEITDALEAELRVEIPGLQRVEIHLEPREPQRVEGRVATAEHQRLVREVGEIARSHPPIERCHEVAVTRTEHGLLLVLHCDAAPHRTIGEIHQASLRVEDEIHRRFPQVATVTVHFEPSGPQGQGA